MAHPSAVVVAFASTISISSAVAAPDTPLTPAPSERSGANLLANPGFDGASLRPWSVNISSASIGHTTRTGGGLCLALDRATPRRNDVIVRQSPVGIQAGHRYQVRFRVHAGAPTRLRVRVGKMGSPDTEIWSAIATAGTAPATQAGSFTAAADEDSAELTFELGGDLQGAAAMTVCLDDVELNDPQFEPPRERTAPPPPRVRVNQVGYLPSSAKIAALPAETSAPLEWQLYDRAGRVVAGGQSRAFGEDAAAGELVHQIDFSSVTAAGDGYRLRVGDDESPPFAIGKSIYHRMKYDALAFFYLQRSGVPIEMPYAGSAAYVRPPGHPGDKSVACAPEAPCSYRLDVSGGWYDAGDHGKYVVDSGFAVWMLQNQYETLSRFGATARDFADGTMNIPERKNKRPDLLDEARFNLEFMLRMQVPAGQPLAGMAHLKVHDNRWTPIPTLPDQDTTPRYLRPPTTAATLNLAAAAAQAARIWRPMDPAFAARCLTAAETAFAAALANPHLMSERETPGGGTYADGGLDDERYWAAAELYITTGKPAYKAEIDRSRFASSAASDGAAVSELQMMNWDHVAGLGILSLLVAPSALPAGETATLRRRVSAAAARLRGFIDRRGYRMPLPSDLVYVWGSNAGVLDAGIVLGMDYYLTHDPLSARGALDCMDYLLGRNPLAQSYVSGYGARAMRNPHHRVWAHLKNASLPEAPPGAMSGGPNSMMQDPYIRALGKTGCPPQTCYVDNTDSYSTNEVAINWNASLAWLAAFADDLARAR
jgi:endoglucanase